MEIIDKTKTPSPMYVRKDAPTIFKTDLDRQRYNQKEMDRWYEGYSGLSPIHYFGMQECPIKLGAKAEKGFMTWRDIDSYIYEAIEKARKNKKHLFVVKRREAGFSCVGGVTTNYYMRMNPGSTSLVTSADKSRIYKLYSDKIAFARENMRVDVRPDVIKARETASEVYLKIAIKMMQNDGKIDVAHSEIFSRDTSDSDKSASSFSGSRAAFGLFDEIQLHPRRKILLQSSEACFHEGGVNDGFLLMGGTVEKGITNESLADIYNMWQNAENLNIDTLFIPAWMGLKQFMVNGHSDEKAGTEFILRERERLSKLDDKSYLNAHMKNYPLTLDEVFDLAKGQRFEEDVTEMIRHKLKKVKDIPPAIWRGGLISQGNETITIESKKETVHILEHPKPHVDYWVLCDLIAGGTEASGERGSNIAATIFKGQDPNGKSYCPIALYSDRPSRNEDGYRMIVNMMKFANKFGKLKGIDAEANIGQADSLSSFLKHDGMGHFIINRKDISGKKNSDVTKPFQYITIDTRNFQYDWFNIFLRKYIDNIDMPVYLEQMLKPVNDNTDELDSLLLAAIVLPKNFDAPVNRIQVARTNLRPIRVMKDGFLVWELK